MKYTLIIPFFLLFFQTDSIAQENLTKQQVSTYKTMIEKAEGTYQVQMIATRQTPAIPISIIQLIEDNRHAVDTVYVDYNSKMRIMILPQDLIDNGNYTHLSQIQYVAQ